MTEDLCARIRPLVSTPERNVVLNLSGVPSMDVPSAEALVQLQQSFYESGASFVVCCLQPPVEAFLDEESLLEVMNVTPSESEAGDIVQMEEIERELLGDDDEADPSL